MLVLSRKKKESIIINNEITVVVVEIRGDKVRLGIEAPETVPVHRQEVHEAIQREKLNHGERQDGSPEPAPSLVSGRSAPLSGFTRRDGVSAKHGKHTSRRDRRKSRQGRSNAQPTRSREGDAAGGTDANVEPR